MNDETHTHTERSNSVKQLPGFAQFAEGFCAGFRACRDGLADDDGEVFMAGLMSAYRNSGSQRAKRLIEEGSPEEIAAALREATRI